VATLAGKKATELKIEIAVASDVSGSVVLTARAPDGSAAETTLWV